MEDLTTFLEEAYVSEAKCHFYFPFFWGVGAKVFTGAHGKEDGGRI